MGTIKNLANRFKALNFDLIKQESLRETAPSAIPQYNREQLRAGQLSDGNLITPQLGSLTYALTKENKGGKAPFMTPDLFETGSFQADITTTITSKTIKTFSLDLKGPSLQLKYSPLIYGANPSNLSKYATQDLQPVLHKKLREATVG